MDKINNISILGNKDEPKKLPESEMWKIYLNLLNIFQKDTNAQLTNKEITVTSTMLSLDLSVSYFTKRYSKSITSRVEDCSYNELYRIKLKLLKLGLIKESKEQTKDGREKSYYFIDHFKGLKKIMESGEIINFNLILKNV